MSTSFGKDPQNPRDGGDGEGGKWPEVIKAEKQVVIGGGSSNIGAGSGGIKHLSDPHNPRWPTGGGSGVCSTEFGGIILRVGGTNEGITKTGSRIPVIWKEYDLQDGNGESIIIKDPTDTINDGTGFGDVVCVPVIHVVINDPTETIDQEDWFGPATGPNPVPNGGSDYLEGEGGYIEGDYGFSGDWGFSGEGLLIEGGWDAKGGDSGYISDTTGLISDTNIPKHEVPKNGDDQYDACTKEWCDGTGWGRTSEDISDGGPSIMVDPTSWKDPTWVSGHTSTFRSGDWGT